MKNIARKIIAMTASIALVLFFTALTNMVIGLRRFWFYLTLPIVYFCGRNNE
jgi:hypothetical protein